MNSLVENLMVSGLVEHDNGPATGFDSWTHTVRRSLLRFHFDCPNRRTFQGTITQRSAPSVDFFTMESDRHAAYREQDTILPSEKGYYLMTLQLSGQFQICQAGRKAVLKPGWFGIYDSSKPATLISSDDYKSVCIKFPKSSIGAESADALDDIIVAAFDSEKGLSLSVWAMVFSLNQSLGSLGRRGNVATRNMMELVTIMLRTEFSKMNLTGHDNKPLLRQEVRDYIESRLSDPNLNPEQIAAAHYISLRRLHKAFSAADSTVAGWIRSRRIAMCCRDLRDPAMTRVPVASVGMRWGFPSASHFGHVFKREVGQSPAEFRRNELTALSD